MSSSTARLGIMSADQFKNRTKATANVCGFSSHFKSRGSSMDGIDAALDAWDRIHNAGKQGDNEQARLVTLSKLKSSCGQYLQARDTKGTALSAQRKAVVSELLKAAETAESYVSKRGASAAGPARATKSLIPGYDNERKQYEHFNKQSNPYSASALHGKGDQSTTGRFVALGAETGAQRVEFMKRDERLKYLLIVKNGRLFQDGEPYSCSTTKTPAIRAATYAMDKYGNLFSKKVAEASKDNLRFNHSTYCAGKEVICAGTLTCLDGQLLKITNMSGHYAPQPTFLRSAVTLLGEEGVDLEDVALEGFDCVAGDGFCTASTFVQTGARAPADWRYPFVQPTSGPWPSCKVDHNGIQYEVWEPA